MSKTLVLCGELSDDMVRRVVHAPQSTPIVLCSEGGPIYLGRALHDLLTTRTVIAAGSVMSSALVAYAGAGERLALPSAVFLHHPPYEVGGSPSSRDSISDLGEFHRWACTALARSSLWTEKQWKEDSFIGRVFTAQAASERGLVHRIVGPSRLCGEP